MDEESGSIPEIAATYLVSTAADPQPVLPSDEDDPGVLQPARSFLATERKVLTMEVMPEDQKPIRYLGVSKLRLMAGRSQSCVVCGGPTERSGYPRNHLCADHAHVRLAVVDSSSEPSSRRLGEYWTEMPDAPEQTNPDPGPDKEKS